MKFASANIRLPLELLAAAGFLSSAGARVVDALLDAIAHDFHTDVPRVAIVLAAFPVPSGLSHLVGGPLAHGGGKPQVLVGALIAYGAAITGCALSTGLTSLTLLRMLSGMASAGLIPVCLAYIGDATSYADRQIVLSRFLVGVVIAQIVIGPVGGLFGQLLTWRGVFLVLAAAAFSLAASVLWQIRRLPASPRVEPTARDFAALGASGPRLLLVLTMVDGVVFTGTIPFIAPFLHERLGLTYAEAGLVLACFGIGCWVYIKLAPKLVAGLEERQIVLAGGLVAAAGMALAALAWLWPAYIAAEILLGLGYFMLHSVLQARATEMLPNARGTAVSSFAFALFMGQALGALLCAGGIAAWGYRTVFAIDCPALLALSLALWFHLRPRTSEGWHRRNHKAEQT